MSKNNDEFIDINKVMDSCANKTGEFEFYKYDLIKTVLLRYFDEFENNEDKEENELLNKEDNNKSEGYYVAKNTLKKFKFLKNGGK